VLDGLLELGQSLVALLDLDFHPLQRHEGLRGALGAHQRHEKELFHDVRVVVVLVVEALLRRLGQQRLRHVEEPDGVVPEPERVPSRHGTPRRREVDVRNPEVVQDDRAVDVDAATRVAVGPRPVLFDADHQGGRVLGWSGTARHGLDGRRAVGIVRQDEGRSGEVALQRRRRRRRAEAGGRNGRKADVGAMELEVDVGDREGARYHLHQAQGILEGLEGLLVGSTFLQGAG